MIENRPRQRHDDLRDCTWMRRRPDDTPRSGSARIHDMKAGLSDRSDRDPRWAETHLRLLQEFLATLQRVETSVAPSNVLNVMGPGE